MTDIPITGVGDSWLNPGEYVQLAFAQGAVSGSSATRKILIPGPKMSTGTATVNVAVRAKKEADVITWTGAGSPIHRMFRFVQKVNKTAEIWILPYAETASGSPVAAVNTTTVVCAGATSATSWTRVVCGESFTVPIAAGAVAADIAGDMRDMIASATWLPVSVSGSSAAVTLTAKVKGIRGGAGSYFPLKIVDNAPGCGVTFTGAGDVGSTTPGAEGTTTEAASLAAALAANTSTLFYYTVTDTGGDTACAAALAAHLASQALPLGGKRGFGIMGYNGALAAGITIANARNYERQLITFGLGTDHAPDEIAAQIVGIFQKYTVTDPTYNFDGYTGADWFLRPSSDSSDWPTSDDINDAILGGLTPISARIGDTSLVTAITTRTLDSTGTYMDMRASEVHRVSGADVIADRMQSSLGLNLRGSKICADPLLADGVTVDANAIAKFPRGMHCPFTVTPMLKKEIEEGVRDGILDPSKEDTMLESVQVFLSSTVNGRFEIGVSIYTINIYHQSTIYIAESTEG